MAHTIYFPENLANYNFGLAAVIGLIILFLVIGVIIGTSRGRKVRRRPE